MKDSEKSSGSPFSLRAYRSLVKGLFKVVRQTSEWTDYTFGQGPFEFKNSASLTRPGVWFHGASVGECDMLIPVIDRMVESRQPITALSAFSPSAKSMLLKLRERWTLEQVAYIGPSPQEGEWSQAFSQLMTNLFVTAKYEAWPDLWVALRHAEIPLCVVSARPRSSLKWGSKLVERLGGKIPRMHFLLENESHLTDLQNMFVEAKIAWAGQPRWDRVWERAQKPSPAAEKWISQDSSAPRPWGILGSTYEEDYSFWRKVLEQSETSALKGTLWIVPHHVSGEKFEKAREFQSYLQEKGTETVLVDEMGVLADLYRSMDWAYVGGGFGEGIHSTIEPAIHGLPVAVGPKKVSEFEEVNFLLEGEQITIMNEPHDMLQWLANRKEALDLNKRKAWIQRCHKQLGASERIVRELMSI